MECQRSEAGTIPDIVPTKQPFGWLFSGFLSHLLTEDVPGLRLMPHLIPAREQGLCTDRCSALALLFTAVTFLIVTRALHVFSGTEQKLAVKPNVVWSA